jgi:hypothetical protein
MAEAWYFPHIQSFNFVKSEERHAEKSALDVDGLEHEILCVEGECISGCLA